MTEDEKHLIIEGKMTADYFKIVCQKCGDATINEYLGWDPAIPHFKATCKKCGTTGTWKLSISLWEGLPHKPE